MRIMVLALTGMAIAVTGMLAVGVADPAFAQKRQDPNWRDTPIPNQSAQFYRSSKKTNWRDTPIPNQSAQFYRSSHHKKPKKPAEDK